MRYDYSYKTGHINQQYLFIFTQDLMNQEVNATTTLTPQKKRKSAPELIDGDSDADQQKTEIPEDVKPSTRNVQLCSVNLDHAVSYWDDPKSPQFFVSVVLFLPSKVDKDTVHVSVPSRNDRLD